MKYRNLLPVALWGLGLVSCASTSIVPCSNEGDCEKAGGDFSYCSRNRCVECVSNASCGDGNLCVDGTCERHCKDARDCRDGERCSDGKCAT
ncbi:MAG TPA: hypothetical protein VL400_18760 [Polyangiaceae bacterium]|jgi:hypothetical protein|nr:hypothetical protein [Polyangiaceae bacterium]